jgi:hypothetical protein
MDFDHGRGASDCRCRRGQCHLSRDNKDVVGPPIATMYEFITGLPLYSLQLAHSNSSSPQAKALAWIMNDARYPLYRLNQRYALAALYYSTNGDSWVENFNWLSKDNECEWYLGSSGDSFGGCDEGSRLSKLYFFSNNMDGAIPAELELLTNLEQMKLIDRSIDGTIPTEL